MIRVVFLFVFAIGTIWGTEVKAAAPKYPVLACKSMLSEALTSYDSWKSATVALPTNKNLTRRRTGPRKWEPKLREDVVPIVSLMKDLKCPLRPLKSGLECIEGIWRGGGYRDDITGRYKKCVAWAVEKYK